MLQVTNGAKNLFNLLSEARAAFGIAQGLSTVAREVPGPWYGEHVFYVINQALFDRMVLAICSAIDPKIETVPGGGESVGLGNHSPAGKVEKHIGVLADLDASRFGDFMGRFRQDLNELPRDLMRRIKQRRDKLIAHREAAAYAPEFQCRTSFTLAELEGLLHKLSSLQSIAHEAATGELGSWAPSRLVWKPRLA